MNVAHIAEFYWDKYMTAYTSQANRYWFGRQYAMYKDASEEHSRYKNLIIRENEEGFSWQNGGDSGGYFDTLLECQQSIDEYWVEETAREEPHPDTPSLQDSYGDAWAQK